MKNHYYFYGSLIGLVIATITAYAIMGKNFTEMLFSFSKYNGFIPLVAGAWSVLIMARWCDKTIQRHTLIYKGIIIPIFIFSIGAITGSLINLMNVSSAQPFTPQAFDYFVKPIYWLGLIGLPATIIVGIGHYFVNGSNK